MKNLKLFVLDMTIAGGVERVCSNMAIYFSKLTDQYTVEIISMFGKNKKIPYSIPDNVKVTYLYTNCYYKKNTLFQKILSNIYILIGISKLSFGKDDVLISNMANISDMLSLFKHRNKGKLVLFEHAYHGVFGRFSTFSRRLLYPRADCIVTLTNSERDYFVQYHRSVYCIPNSLSFYPNKIANYCSKRVIAIGRLCEEKGFIKLIPVYNNLARKYKDWEFAIFGSGDLQNQIEQQLVNAPSNVRLYQSTPMIMQEMLQSSLYVCSSLTEAFPMVMLEAMACGLPVISFDCPCGPREIINDGSDGILVPINDYTLLEDSISKLIDDQSAWDYISHNARNNIKRFLPECIFDRWNQLILNLYNK